MKEEVVVKISKDGEISIEINGIKGVVCKDITSVLEQVLGVRVTSSIEKPEYFHEIEGIKNRLVQ